MAETRMACVSDLDYDVGYTAQESIAREFFQGQGFYSCTMYGSTYRGTAKNNFNFETVKNFVEENYEGFSVRQADMRNSFDEYLTWKNNTKPEDRLIVFKVK